MSEIPEIETACAEDGVGIYWIAWFKDTPDACKAPGDTEQQARANLLKKWQKFEVEIRQRYDDMPTAGYSTPIPLESRDTEGDSDEGD